MKERAHVIGSSMPHRIADHNRGGAMTDGRGVETFNCLGIAARGVFGYVHHLKTQRPGEAHRFFGRAEKKIVGPILGIASDGAGTEKRSYGNGHAGSLGNLGYWTDIIFMGSRGAVGFDL